LVVTGTPSTLSASGTWSLRLPPAPPRTPADGEIVLSFVLPNGVVRQWTRLFVGRDFVTDQHFLYYHVGAAGSCDLRKLDQVNVRVAGEAA
jgi:hypothetical protein